MQTDILFYVMANNGQYVPARFLSYNGEYVVDPNGLKAAATPIYASPGDTTPIDNANPNGYLIVPESYTLSDAASFAGQVSSLIQSGETLDGGGSDLVAAAGLMGSAFLPNGQWDLQRSYQDSTGANPGDFVNAFTDAASWNLGFVSELSGWGTDAALMGGGALNRFQDAMASLLGGPSLDTSGEDGNTALNAASIQAGGDWAQQNFPSSAAGNGGGAGGSGADSAANGHAGDAGKAKDPLVLDLAGTGINLTRLTASSTMFDMTADGFANRTAWVGAGSALLAMDPDGGPVKDASQLITSFAQLTALDSNGDGVIDASDPAYRDLKVWVGSSTSGMATGSGTLMSLSDAGIASINVSSTASSETLNGNVITATGSFTLTTGAVQTVAAVDLGYSSYATAPDTPVAISSPVSALPTLSGSGTLRDLRSAMMGDAMLTQLVEALANTTDSDPANLESEVQAVMFEWAGVANDDPASRGFYVSDARKLEFVERYLGQAFVAADGGEGSSSNPGMLAADDMQLAWNDIYSAGVARLVLQSGVGATVLPEFAYNATADVVYPVGGFAQALSAALTRLGAPAPSNWSAWEMELRAGYAAALDAGIPQALYEQIVANATSDEVGSLANAVANGISVTIGANGQVTETGTTVSDIIYAGQGITELDGNGGGANFATPGLIGDTFSYKLGDGTVKIVDNDRWHGTPLNTLFLNSIDEASLHVRNAADGSLVLTDGVAGDQITLDNSRSNALDGIQQVKLVDGRVLTANQLDQMAMAGTTGDDFIYGTANSEVLDGKGGNDYVNGEGGSDTVVFNQGYGKLEVNEVDYSTSDVNVLALGVGIRASTTTVAADSSGDLYLNDGTAGDSIRLDAMMSALGALNSVEGVQQVQFADGTIWTAQQLVQMAHQVTGTTGNDTLSGTPGGADVFDGQGGMDRETGNGHNDTFVFNQGYGSLEISEADYTASDMNVLKLGTGITASLVAVTADSAGNLYLSDGTSGDLVKLDGLLSNSANGIEQVQFIDGSTWTRSQLIGMETTGTSGADTLYGSTGADILDGKGGLDKAIGGGGNDTFVYNQGYGNLEINEVDYHSNDVNVLKLGVGIGAASTVVTGDSAGDIFVSDGASGDSIKLDAMMSFAGTLNTTDGVQQVQFADGTVWTAQQLIQMAHHVTGTTGSDTLGGTLGGADVFDGKGGTDKETGNGRNDTFVFNQGYGGLEINEVDYVSGDVNVLKLGAGISASSTVVTADSAGNIVITDGVAGDSIRLDSMMSLGGTLNAAEGVQQVQFADGTVWTAQQLAQMTRSILGTSGNDALTGTSGSDVFDGRGGTDRETGNGGNDTFVFNQGYGSLEINEVDFASGDTNVLKLGAGITASSVGVTADSSGNLYVTDGVAGDRIKLDSLLSGSVYGIEQVQFADGTTWSRAQLVGIETTGTAGGETLYGSSAADVIDGRGGNDKAVGGGGGDTFIYNQGYGGLEVNEIDYASGDVNVLKLGAGISASSIAVTADSSGDIVLADGVAGDSIRLDAMMSMLGALNTSEGVQQVQFADGTVWTAQQLIQMAHQVMGTAGSDALVGTPGGADVFDGKGGTDKETGNGHNDTFVFNQGYGSLEVNEIDYATGDVNVLKLGAGISASSLEVTADSSGNLYVTDGVAGDRIKLDSLLSSRVYGIQQIQFADGTMWNRAQLVNVETTGTSAADTLYGSSGADVLDGRGGLDKAIGGGGSDTFVYNQGYGSLEVNEVDYVSGDVNVLKLGAGISASSTVVTADSAGNIVITDGVAGDSIRLDAMMSMLGALNTSEGVQQVQFADGTVWTAQQLIQMAHQVNGTAGNDTLVGTPGGADVFDGRGGADKETGNGHNDTFVFNQGYGSLEINEVDFASGDTNVLKLGAGITASSVGVTADSSGNLYVTDGVAGDRIKLDSLLSGSVYGIEQVQFADGTTLTAQQLIGMETTGTSGNDTLFGTSTANIFDGKSGNDIEYGAGGNDTYVFQPAYGALTIVNGTPGSNVVGGDLSIQGVDPSNLWLQRVGNNLQVDIMGSTNSATIQNWYSNTYSQLGEVTVSGGSGGSMALDAQINQLVQAMATYSSQNPGFDPTSSANPQITDPTVLAAVSSSWHHA